MDITIHHELHGAAVWILIGLLALIAFALIYSMVMPSLALLSKSPSGPMGFIK